MDNKITEHRFISFDGGVKCDGLLVVPDDNSVLLNNQIGICESRNGVTEALESNPGVIPRGAGMSFAAASFGDGVTSIDMRKLDRIVVLENDSQTITVEAGVSVGVLLKYLLSHGYFLSTLPGYPTITVGGCIAADVHGKNQARDGNFINQVEAFTLHHLDHGEIQVSRNDNRELFDLTIGGFGLTGTVLSVILKVKPIASPLIDMSVQPIDDIFALPQLLCEAAGVNDYVVTWHDFNQAGARFGSGFLQSGIIVNGESSHSDSTVTTFPIKQFGSTTAPLTLASENRGIKFPSTYCRVTTGVMNAFYQHSQGLKVGSPSRVSVDECYFPSKVFRDLYFHAFGKIGLHEHQLIVPINQFSNYIEQVRWWLQKNDLPITMASSKLFNGSKQLLRFNGIGVCFALDFPRCQTASKFLTFLDELTIETQSIPNVHKDSRLPLSVAQRAYSSEYDNFRSRLLAFDPRRKYQSELSRRLAL